MTGGTDRWGSLLVAVAGLLALVLAAVVGSVLLFGGDGSTPAADGRAPEATPSASGSTTPAGAPTEAVTDPAEPPEGSRPTGKSRPELPTTPAHDAAASYRCWDGRGVADLSACASDPTGVKGLRWVFPGASEPACERQAQPGRPAFVECTIPASSGGAVAVHYTQWSRWSDGNRHYEGLEVRKRYRWRGLVRWDIAAVSPNPPYKTALMYPDAPWSVTVYGWSVADRDEFLDRLQWKLPGDLRGVSLR